MTIGEQAVKKAIKAGMDEAEAYVTNVKRISVNFSSEIESYKVVENIGLGLRVAKGKKLAMEATSILTDKEVDRIVDKAVKIANVSPEDPNWNNFNKKFASVKVEGTYDKSTEDIGYDKIIESIFTGINKATENERKVKVTRGAFNIYINESSIVNSYNDLVSRKGTYMNFFIMCKAIEGGDSTGAEGQSTRFFKDIEFLRIGDKAAEQALKYVNAKPIESTKMPVIFKNEFFGNIAGLMLGSNINSENKQKGRSSFADKIDTQITDERITVVDDGLKPKGMRTRAFDDEGQPLQKTQIIEKGVLKNFIYDNYRGQKENVPSTGNARRQYHTAPSPSVNNFIVEPGKTSPEDIIKDTKKGFYVDRTIGEWLSRPTSGELNATVTHGYLIENGEFVKPVNNVIISGNFFDLIKNKVDIIGNDPSTDGFIYTPSIKFSEITIAGK
ncbi:MAG: TldD/PmbA family protein [Candidatus Heimdallarchaeota archaeon]